MKKLQSLFFITLIAVFALTLNADGICKETKEKSNASEKQGTKSDDKKTSDSASADKQQQKKQIIVYYFMGNQRCTNCINFEKYTKASLNENFSKELKDSSIVWKMINVDKTENEHYIKDYELYTKSVILSEISDGKETKKNNLTEIWSYVKDEGKFKEYIKEEIIKFRNGE